MTECPQCGGEVWNNARKNEQRANEGKKPMPLFTCKDKQGCGWIKWPPKNQGGGAGNRSSGHRASGGATGAGPRLSRPLGPLYNESMAFAQKACAFYFKGKETPADVIAATATVFIQAVRDGANIASPPKPKPRPEPEPEVEQEFEEFPGDDGFEQAASSLPF